MDVLHVLAVSVLCGMLLYLRHRRETQPPTPSGPRGWPIIGNTLDMPSTRPWETYARWAQLYGSVTRLSLLGKPMIILNSAEAVRTLFEGRAARYSNRPRSTFSHDLMDISWSLTISNGKQHSERRTVVERHFSGINARSYETVQLEEARRLATGLLLADGADVTDHFKLYAASVIMRITYGYKVNSNDDPLILDLQRAIDYGSRGMYLVDVFPFLKYYPEWMPFAGFRRDGRLGRESSYRMRDVPFRQTRERMAAGRSEACFVSEMLADSSGIGELTSRDLLVRDSAGVMYAAGSDTTAATLLTFMALLQAYPEVQKRAQLEVLQVTGGGRLPTFKDRDTLPYLQCVLLEVLRYNVLLPIGLPRVASEDDTYASFRIPKGATVTANIWSIFRDPVVFPNPDHFDPSRFEGDNSEIRRARETVQMIFGWGRRACPGRDIAQGAIFIAMVTVLSTLHVSRISTESDGQSLKDLEWSAGAMRRPLAVACRIAPLNEEARLLLESVEG